MTRLKEEWISGIPAGILNEEFILTQKTGLSYLALAASASGVPLSELKNSSRSIKVAVVTISSGLGVIKSFSASVAAIISGMGFDSFIMENTNVAGIFEASNKNADVIFLADDDRFIALNLNNGQIAENDEATVHGYIEILKRMANGLNGKTVLVCGFGRLGFLAAKILKLSNVNIAVFDTDKYALDKAASYGANIVKDIAEIKHFPLIFDATSQGGWLGVDILNENAIISAPGVPLSLDKNAMVQFGSRTFHDDLPIGTAVMLAMALKQTK